MSLLVRVKRFLKPSGVAGLAVLLTVTGTPLPSLAAAGTFSLGTDSSYAEDSGASLVNTEFVVSGTQDYSGGNVTFEIDGANEVGEVLAFQESTPSTTAGAISVQNGTVFRGDGTSALPIGNVDGSLNGNSEDLKVNFTNAFSNGDFSSGSAGWTVTDSRAYLGYVTKEGVSTVGATKIGGFDPPVDAVWGPGAYSNSLWDLTPSPNTFSHSASGNLTMTVGGASCQAGYCVVRGPYVVSDSSVYLSTGDSVSFNWSASAAGDGFDVYGYLLNTTTGKAVKLIDETGEDSRSSSGAVTAKMGFARVETGYFSSGTRRTDLQRFIGGAWSSGQSVYDDSYFTDGTAFEAGSYKFVFVAGSYDDSGGQYLGATFSIDDVAVTSSTPAAQVTAADVQALGRLLTYSNTSGADTTRTLKFSSSLLDTATDDGVKSLAITGQLNDLPALQTPATISYTDTSAVNTFNNATGTLSASDVDGDTLSFGATGATVSGATATAVGLYGRLEINTATGAYTFIPDSDAINALSANATETFTVAVSDGQASATATLTISISAVADLLPTRPVITAVTAGNSSLSVVFTTPTYGGSTPITNYKYSTDGVTYLALSPAQTTSPIVVAFESADGVSPLVNGTVYSISLKAVNSGGDSPSSASVSGTPVAPAISSSPLPTVRTPQTEPLPIPRRVVLPPQPPVQAPVLQNNQPSAPPSAPTANINGVPTNVTTVVTNPNTLNIQTGSVNLGVNVNNNTGLVRQGENGETEVQVRMGGVTGFQGTGLAPRSFVQVFMPLQGTNAKELARIPVDETGAFNGEAVFATGLQDEPLPVGRQTLQMVTVDEQGRQAVVEFTVNIVQPPPSPELNREAGQRPLLGPGQSLATQAGVPVPIVLTVLPDQGQTLIEGDGWQMGIGVNSETGVQETDEGGALLNLVRDEEALVSGDGFMPGTRADIWLFSEPTLLGTIEIDENGKFSGSVAIDPNLVATGEHTLQLQGVGGDGYVRAANLGVVVTDPVEAVTSAEIAGGLMWWLWALVAAVIVAGGLYAYLQTPRGRELWNQVVRRGRTN